MSFVIFSISVRTVTLRRLRWVLLVEYMSEIRNAYRSLVRNLEKGE